MDPHSRKGAEGTPEVEMQWEGDCCKGCVWPAPGWARSAFRAAGLWAAEAPGGTALPLLLLQRVEDSQPGREKAGAVASTQGSRLSLPAWGGWPGASQVSPP